MKETWMYKIERKSYLVATNVYKYIFLHLDIPRTIHIYYFPLRPGKICISGKKKRKAILKSLEYFIDKILTEKKSMF